MSRNEDAAIILVVVADDHDRHFTVGSLREVGLQAFSISDPSKALDAVRADPDSFTLMLAETEAVPGLEFAQRARRYAPRLRMLFIVSDESRERARLWDYGTVLSRPFTAVELLSEVRQVLSKPPGP